MKPIQYLKGDATFPHGGDPTKPKMIFHICNNKGGWGSGFVVALSARTKVPEAAYRALEQYPLGYIQIVSIPGRTWVANIIAQDGYASTNNPVPFNINFFRSAMKQLTMFAKLIGMTLHGPRVGCGLGGEKWENVEKVLQEECSNNDVEVFIYDYEG